MKKYLAVAGLLSVAACGSGTPTAKPSATPTGGPALQAEAPGGPQRLAEAPGASGLLAQLDGHTLQVQSDTTQTAVTYTASTTFTDMVTTTSEAVTVGSCVMVRDDSPPANHSSTTAAPPTQPTAVTARAVTISAPVSGSCTPAFTRGGPAGPPPGLTPPSGDPQGHRMSVGGNGGGAFGKVVSRTANGFVVATTRPGDAAQDVTVTTKASTAYTIEKAASASALKVGRCVTAQGPANSTGTVVATAISVRPATNGTCAQGGFGGQHG